MRSAGHRAGHDGVHLVAAEFVVFVEPVGQGEQCAAVLQQCTGGAIRGRVQQLVGSGAGPGLVGAEVVGPTVEVVVPEDIEKVTYSLLTLLITP